MEEEERKTAVGSVAVGDDLTTLSVAELEKRISALEAEIERTKAALASKRASLAAADSFFKS